MILPELDREVLLNDLEYNLGIDLGFKRFEACENHKVINSDSLTMLNGISIENSNISLTCLGGEKCSPFLNIVGEKGFLFIDFDDPYSAFRNTLQKFSENIHHKNILRSQKEIIHSISLIQMGL